MKLFEKKTSENIDTIEVLKALSDETRFKIVRQLARDYYGESCKGICDDFNLSQPAMSFHLTKLTEAGVLTARKVGTEKHYSLNHSLLEQLGIDIRKLAKGVKK